MTSTLAAIAIPPSLRDSAPVHSKDRDREPRTAWYPGVGVAILSRGDFWLAVRCRTYRADAPTGHFHDDDLSFELTAAGVDFVVDPGTGVYTADPVLRNVLRSRSSHSAIGLSRAETNRRARDLFSMRIQSYPKRISLETDGFSASHHVGGVNYMRRFHLESDRLVVEDRFDRPTPHVARVMFAPEVEVLQGPD